jgi:MtN3 and saliva related transmembrane protein
MILVAAFLRSQSTLESIGSIAAACTTVSFVPQLVRVWRRKSARDISLTMFLLFSFGVASWLIYGIGLHARPIIAANAVTLVLALAILILKIRYDAIKPVPQRPLGSSSKIES